MRLFFLLYIFSQLFNSSNVFGEKFKKESSEKNQIKWEKLQEKNSNNLNKIIWRSYNNDKRYFEDKEYQSPYIKEIKNFREDNKNNFQSQSILKGNNLIEHGGITVSNALLPEAGISQISLNYDSKGNLFGLYGYSFSNIFQLEILNIGAFKDLNFPSIQNQNFSSTYLSKNYLNYRVGGKLLILSPQKDELFWMALRASVGRNIETNQGYLYSELINTFRFNEWIAFNLTPKYFYSGGKSFGGLGASSYINILDNLQLIPEINSSFKNSSDFNSSLALRYSFQLGKSIDLYYSNAAGIQDVGQLLEDNEYRFGIKLNFLY